MPAKLCEGEQIDGKAASTIGITLLAATLDNTQSDAPKRFSGKRKPQSTETVKNKLFHGFKVHVRASATLHFSTRAMDGCTSLPQIWMCLAHY